MKRKRNKLAINLFVLTVVYRFKISAISARQCRAHIFSAHRSNVRIVHCKGNGQGWQSQMEIYNNIVAALKKRMIL